MIVDKEEVEVRKKCYICYRPLSSCMCQCVRPIKTNTKFVILMHPKEFKKTKNGTGRLTHLSLPNSELFIEADFTNHSAVNAMINNKQNLCYVLYPDKNSLNLNTQKIESDGKQIIIFIIDSTWPCSVKMLRVSNNLKSLPKISFTHSKCSQFKIKEQPKEFCLSTIESTLVILELLQFHGLEKIEKTSIEHFLDPFNSMVEFQIKCASGENGTNVRFKKRDEFR
ncbi:MAG: DTW domain-containing protein [Sulfuricurvum sp.]|nr:DTW domain-containing protein [Sulfuricurvum sp.]